jgi:hypothetical protein
VKLRSGRRRGQGRGVGVDAYSFARGISDNGALVADDG